MAKKNRVIRYLIPVLVLAVLMQNEDFAADFTRLHSRRYGKLGGYHVLPELAAPVGPDSVSVQLRTDDAELPHSYHSGYPFEAWSGPSLP